MSAERVTPDKRGCVDGCECWRTIEALERELREAKAEIARLDKCLGYPR